MVYGNRFCGVLEANYSMCSVHLATWVFGPSMWDIDVPVPAMFQHFIGPFVCEFTFDSAGVDGMNAIYRPTLTLTLMYAASSDLKYIFVVSACMTQAIMNIHR